MAATYDELYILYNDADLINKTTVAVGIAAYAVLTEDPATPNHVARLNWAKQAIVNPLAEGKIAMWGVISSEVVQAKKEAAFDEEIQNIVNRLVDSLTQRFKE